jgi:pimeloyl-ACP methyl ester carboxylesterase
MSLRTRRARWLTAISACGPRFSRRIFGVKRAGTVAKPFERARALLKVMTGLSILAQAAAADRDTQVIGDAVYLHPQRLVAVEKGRRLNLYCRGNGSPTVVFDSGMGNDMTVWALVQPAVAAETRACSYDRAGLGFSDPSPAPRTSGTMVEDLHRLLRAADLRPPYVLVGHSLGGMNAKLYAELHLPEVAGLVFVDPTHEDIGKKGFELDPQAGRQFARYVDLLHQCLKSKSTDFVEGSPLQRTCATVPNGERFSDAINALQRQRLMEPGYMGAWISEQENAPFASSDEVRAARRSFGDIPLILLTREMPKAQSPWLSELQVDTARMSTHGIIRPVKDTSHYIQLDQPQEVIDAVLEVVRISRTNQSR